MRTRRLRPVSHPARMARGPTARGGGNAARRQGRPGGGLEIASFGGDARIQQAMAADGIDIGLGSGPGLAFIVKGSPVKGIAAMAGPPLLFAVVARADDTVNSV